MEKKTKVLIEFGLCVFFLCALGPFAIIPIVIIMARRYIEGFADRQKGKKEKTRRV